MAIAFLHRYLILDSVSLLGGGYGLRVTGYRLLFILMLSFIGISNAQEALLNNPFTSTDTVRIDSTLTDTTSVLKDTVASSGGIDTVVAYSCADSIVYHFSTKTMSLYKNSSIQYQTMELKSEQIGIDWKTNMLSAEGVADSTDTLHGGYRGTPVMKDGGEQYDGRTLTYNFQTKKGKINIADTKMDEGFYHGEDIKKVDKDILFVAKGRYTTCDAPEPHYYFGSPKMKVKMQDQVVAEPVYLFIADVPVFALPFAVFPNKGGRRSGIIAPAYGEDGTRGRFLRHLGFYWAMNDYMDWKVQTDLYSKGGWAAASNFQYNVRYNFTGSFSGEYKRLHAGEENDPRRTEEESYRATINHNQDIDPTTRLNVDFTFASDNAYRNTIDYQEALQQTISSNATLSKHWESPNSITLNVSRQQYLIKGDVYETMPSLSFNHGTSYPFRRKKAGDESSDLNWYEQIGLNYGMSASNSRSKTKISVNNIKQSMNGVDTLLAVEEFQRGNAQRIGQSMSISIAPKLGYITVSPSLHFSDSRDFSSTDVPVADTSDSSLSYMNKKEAKRIGTLSTGLSLNTRIFGILQPNALGISAIRHTLTPSVSFAYDKQVYGDNPEDKRLYANFNVGNVFEMKTIPEAEGKEGTKIQLLNVGLGASYDFTADSMNLSNLGMNFRTGIGRTFDINGGANFDFYKLEESSPGRFNRVNKFELSENGRLARLTNFNIRFSTSLSGEKKKSGSQPAQRDSSAGVQPVRSRSYDSMAEPDFSIPWQLSLDWSYSESRSPSVVRSSSINGNLDFNLTEKWKFAVASGYDFVNQEFVYPRMNISRDLHCWTMNFSWTPIGQYRSYQFEIRVKASQLQDLKVTKSGSDRGIY
ncbi:MAG: LPS-assembly protein LptD [Ignavibacteriae bacterium]|nr:LPS-assembly protein LptD [Ignavibacteriota bacterium]